MSKRKNFYNVFYNKASKSVDIDIFGAIVSGSKESKWDDTDFTLEDLQSQLEEADDFDTINLNVSSPGGSVFVASAIMSILQKYKNKGVTVKAYILGVAASAASYLIMVADEIYMGKSAMVMIHKPLMSSVFFMANAPQLRKIADDLDDMENGVLINSYMMKATENLTKENLKTMLEKETWLSYDDMKKYFDVKLIENDVDMVACVDDSFLNYLSKYQNIPQSIKTMLNKTNSLSPITSSFANDRKAQKLKIKLDLI